MATAEEVKTKYLKNEVAAFEQRLAAVKSSVESLTKQKETLMSEIEEAKVRHNKDVEEKHNAIRSASAVIDSQRAKLASDKKEFEDILNAFKHEKASFEKEKQTALDMKADAQKTLDRCGSFIVAVRNLAQGL